jgi:hypothetical protein
MKDRQLGNEWHDWRGKNLLREDWDFQKCEEWEQFFCLEYERGREFVAKRQAVAHCRNEVARQEAWDWDDGQLYMRGLDESLAFLPEFPDKPWLSVPVARRTDWIARFGGVWLPRDAKKWKRMIETKDLQRSGYTVETVGVKNLLDTESGTYQDRVEYWDGTRLFTYQIFSVNWGAANCLLKKDFERWLQDNRPKDAKPYKGCGRTSEKEILKMLGTRRLLLAYSLAKAEKIWGDLPHHGERSCRRAKAKAEAYLKTLGP